MPPTKWVNTAGVSTVYTKQSGVSTAYSKQGVNSTDWSEEDVSTVSDSILLLESGDEFLLENNQDLYLQT